MGQNESTQAWAERRCERPGLQEKRRKAKRPRLSQPQQERRGRAKKTPFPGVEPLHNFHERRRTLISVGGEEKKSHQLSPRRHCFPGKGRKTPRPPSLSSGGKGKEEEKTRELPLSSEFLQTSRPPPEKRRKGERKGRIRRFDTSLRKKEKQKRTGELGLTRSSLTSRKRKKTGSGPRTKGSAR